MLKRYVHGVGSDDPLVSYDGSGTANPTYLLADERGSIMAETNSAGTVTTKHQYGPYGEPINNSASRFRYTGQILLPGTALYHYKARVYHPKLGCFLQTDPIGYKDGMNWYAYVGNDPMNAVDPDGQTGRFRDGDRLGGLGSVIGEITGAISPETAESIRAGQEGRLPEHLKKADSQSQTNRSRTSKTEKHHVVPHRDRRDAGARANMKANGINPKTESTNIVPISGDKHDITKRESYVNSTNDRIEAQNGPDEIRAECCKIANELTTKSTEELDKAYPRKK